MITSSFFLLLASSCGVKIRSLAPTESARVSVSPSASPAPAGGISIVSGNGQTIAVSQEAGTQLRVRAIGSDGQPLAGLSLLFVPTHGGGWSPSGTVTTDGDGYASARFFAGALDPDQTVRVRAVGTSLPAGVADDEATFSLTSLSSGDGTFTPTADDSVTASPYFTVAADVNDDGNLDLITAHNSSNFLAVKLGLGSGTFGAAASYPTQTYPMHVTVSDLNGDGRQDLVSTNKNSNSISVFLASGAAGNFAAKTDYAVGSAPYASVAGDFNADGYPDLAVANNADSTVTVLFNQPSSPGTFAPSGSYFVNSGPKAIRAGDLNGDGRLDLVTGNWTSNDVSVLLASGTAGTFAAAVHYVAGTQPRSLALSDYDRDGKLDIAVANYGSSSVGILINSSTTPGTFGAMSAVATGTSPHAIESADLNGDDLPDLVVGDANASAMYHLLNNGSSPGSMLAPVTETTPSVAYSVAVGDFDGDNKVDIVTANTGAGSLKLFRGN